MADKIGIPWHISTFSEIFEYVLLFMLLRIWNVSHFQNCLRLVYIVRNLFLFLLCLVNSFYFIAYWFIWFWMFYGDRYTFGVIRRRSLLVSNKRPTGTYFFHKIIAELTSVWFTFFFKYSTSAIFFTGFLLWDNAETKIYKRIRWNIFEISLMGWNIYVYSKKEFSKVLWKVWYYFLFFIF